MRRSTFKRPKMVLIFNGAQVLVAVTLTCPKIALHSNNYKKCTSYD